MLSARVVLLSTVLLSACASGRNYDAPHGPRYTGGIAPALSPRSTVRIVSFNIQHARQLHAVAAILHDTTDIRNADIVLLQETDLASTEWLARVLGRTFVYVPAMWHPNTRRDYGNAILSAWPVVSTRKILLPHLGRWRGGRRVATAATLCVGGTAVRVYATHLATVSEMGPTARREQLSAVLDDAERYPIAIVGGDFNSRGVTDVAIERGYAWPTADGGPSRGLWAIDHVVVRGATAVDGGVGEIASGVSDHRPVWARVSLDSTVAAACGHAAWRP